MYTGQEEYCQCVYFLVNMFISYKLFVECEWFQDLMLFTCMSA